MTVVGQHWTDGDRYVWLDPKAKDYRATLALLIREGWWLVCE